MSRDARRGQNEVWFRALNERLEERAIEKHGSGAPFEIVCECVREECTERIEVAFDEYEAVRDTATDFIVAHGHVDESIERVSSTTERFDVVTKTGEAAAVAELEDPRG